MLLWGGIAGFVVFGEVPELSTLVGAAVVAAAGLYNWHRETRNLARCANSGLRTWTRRSAAPGGRSSP
jgi:drug/metabolite transporter (DMT)-like permease